MSHPPYWIFPVSNTPKAAIFETYIDVYLNINIIMIYIIVDNKGKNFNILIFHIRITNLNHRHWISQDNGDHPG